MFRHKALLSWLRDTQMLTTNGKMNDELRSILCRERRWNFDVELHNIRFREDNTGLVCTSHIRGMNADGLKVIRWWWIPPLHSFRV
jgi:hypothetical protein